MSAVPGGASASSSSSSSAAAAAARACADGPEDCHRARLQRDRQSPDNMPRNKERAIDKYREKVVNDCIHGHIVLPPAAVAIVDTEQFQRLRHLKQTGNCHLVYPNATHNRFQHSLGVAHLAFKWTDTLRMRYPELIDQKDVLCVMLAGLCHDLGHGPYSHLWEHFIKEAEHDPDEDYRHENTSVKMIDYLIESNHLRPVLEELAGIDNVDIAFVKELIAGPLGGDGLPVKKEERNDDLWQYQGRPEEKSFLYEIVANKWSGVDVDKWDYLLRDDYFMKIGHIFDYQRFIKYSRVEETEASRKRRRIVLRDKEATMLSDMFNDRSRLHLHGYQHRLDAWLLADARVAVNCKGKKLKMSEASIESVEAHEKLTDEYVKHIIMESDSSDPQVAAAQELYKRIAKRELYLDVLALKVKDLEDAEERQKEEGRILSEIQALVPESSGDGLKKEDFTIIRRRITNGEKTKSEEDKKLQLHSYQKNNMTYKASVAMPENYNLLYVCVKRSCVETEARAVIEAWKSKPNLGNCYVQSG